MSAAAVEQAVAHARTAQPEWARAPLAERKAVLLRFLEAMEALNAEIVPELAWQMGRPVRYQGELRSLAERVTAMVAIAEDSLASFEPEPAERISRRVDRAPAGLVLVVAPWNYPYLTAVNTIVPALISGNSVLLKHASQTLLAGERFAQ